MQTNRLPAPCLAEAACGAGEECIVAMRGDVGKEDDVVTRTRIGGASSTPAGECASSIARRAFLRSSAYAYRTYSGTPTSETARAGLARPDVDDVVVVVVAEDEEEEEEDAEEEEEEEEEEEDEDP